jgi:hypothetical protein
VVIVGPFALVAIAGKGLCSGPRRKAFQSPRWGGSWSAIVAGVRRLALRQEAHSDSILS